MHLDIYDIIKVTDKSNDKTEYGLVVGMVNGTGLAITHQGYYQNVVSKGDKVEKICGKYALIYYTKKRYSKEYFEWCEYWSLNPLEEGTHAAYLAICPINFASYLDLQNDDIEIRYIDSITSEEYEEIASLSLLEDKEEVFRNNLDKIIVERINGHN